MTANSRTKIFLNATLEWLIPDPPSGETAWLTAYHERDGIDGLFSVFVRFESLDLKTGKWQCARIFALAEEMEGKLFSVEGPIVITSGEKAIAIAKVFSTGEEVFGSAG
jgi:hypothetical protein